MRIVTVIVGFIRSVIRLLGRPSANAESHHGG
jgi:hypothetical protein